ncbi:MAG TPA: FIST N-terminal domain-containing protein [Candidatus Thermoplasmatota archaeon]|nr:FIST N-terminal domain-containing protein [Candidatus Thermoplasmatota archaeon]
MIVEQRIWTSTGGWQPAKATLQDAQVVLVFGGRDALSHHAHFMQVQKDYPSARFLGGSTAGEIAGMRVLDDSIVVTAIRFDKATVASAEVDLGATEGSKAAGIRLAKAIPAAGLRHVLVVSDGAAVNGSELVSGMLEALPKGVMVTGGLAADGARFEKTLTVGQRGAAPRRLVAVGLYGPGLQVGYGSLGGWDPFGPLRIVTKSRGNVLLELDGKPALGLYKQYLGEHAKGLPATGLLFPLEVRANAGAAGRGLTRTILAVSEAEQSLTFAGDIPQDSVVRLMKANFDRLVDGAQGAAEASSVALGGSRPELALLISCVGRKLVLKQRVEEELEAVQEVLGKGVPMAGFYSNGEICPAAPNADCDLHNQTMTITTLREA